YTLEVDTIYKGEPDVNSRQRITFTTPGDGGLCGVTLTKGEEYLLDLHETEDGLTAGSCDLVGQWDSFSDKDKESVESGCED
ncbi:unnamed protein product, partial [Laminaria digitata]